MTKVDLVGISNVLSKLNGICTEVASAKSTLGKDTIDALKEFIRNIVNLHQVIIDTIGPFYSEQLIKANDLVFKKQFLLHYKMLEENKLLRHPEKIEASCRKIRDDLEKLVKARQGKFKGFIFNILGGPNIQTTFQNWVFQDDAIRGVIRDFRHKQLNTLGPIKSLLEQNDISNARKHLKNALSGTSDYFDRIEVNNTQCGSLLRILEKK